MRIVGIIGVTEMVQTYLNDGPYPLEVTLRIPQDDDITLGGLSIQVGDDVIEGKIMT